MSEQTTAEDFGTLESLSSKYRMTRSSKSAAPGLRSMVLWSPLKRPWSSRLRVHPAAAGDTSIAPDALNKLVRMLDARGWQVTLDAFGDRAVRMALDAYTHAERSNPKPARGRRHRIGHVALLQPDDLPRFARLGTYRIAAAV